MAHGTSGAPPNDDDIGDEDYTTDDINEHDIDPNDPENLQTVESNHVDSYYPEMNESISNEIEGRFHFHIFSFYLIIWHPNNRANDLLLSLNNLFRIIKDNDKQVDVETREWISARIQFVLGHLHWNRFTRQWTVCVAWNIIIIVDFDIEVVPKQLLW